jgi:PAS domain S-box-containing protein
MIVMDRDGRYIRVNRIFGEVCGFPAEEAVAQRFHIIEFPSDEDVAVRILQEIHEGKRSYYVREKRYRHRDGHERWAILSVLVLKDPDGRPLFILSQAQEVTERRRLHEQFLQAQKLEAIGRLAGGMAHDFNNLLTAILGYSDFISQGIDPESPVRRDVQQIQSSADRAGRLIEQLLTFSRQQEINPTVVDINAVVTNTHKMLSRVLGEDIKQEVRLSPDPCRVRADRNRITQAILNLAVNARDAMPDGGRLTVTTSVETIETPPPDLPQNMPPGEYVVITLTDTGVGISPTMKDHIFEPFFSTKNPGQGSGLGLSTVYGIVRQSRGFVTVESVPRRGSSFRILLPRVDA